MKNHASDPVRKERLNPASKARREFTRNKFVEKSEGLDRVEILGDIGRSKNHRLGFVKPIRNGLRKKQNLINGRWSRVETGMAGRENEARFQKEE